MPKKKIQISLNKNKKVDIRAEISVEIMSHNNLDGKGWSLMILFLEQAENC